jgi:hypothetical protein
MRHNVVKFFIDKAEVIEFLCKQRKEQYSVEFVFSKDMSRLFEKDFAQFFDSYRVDIDVPDVYMKDYELQHLTQEEFQRIHEDFKNVIKF